MKKFLAYSCTVLLLMASCRKSDIPSLPTNAAVPEALITLASGSNTIIPPTNMDAYSISVVVNLYFPTGVKPQKFDIVVQKNNDPAKIVTVQANVTTFPTTVTVTGLQLRTLFNTPIAGGDSFTIGANVTTQDGKMYPAFSPIAGGVTYSSALATGQPNNSNSVTFSALCPFVASQYGALNVPTPYTVIQDGWADYTPGQTIMVTVVSATQLEFYYANDVNPQPIVITVDPATNITSATKQAFGGYSSLPTYGTFSVVSISDKTNNIALPCQLTIGVDLSFSSPAGSFGTGVITLQKK